MRSRPDDVGQGGSALIIALVIVGLMSIILAALVSFATTSQRTVGAYRESRTDRYDTDGAIKAAVNWAKATPNVGLDPLLAQSPCVYRYEGMTVSCAADADSDSGRPAEIGLVPPEALLMLGSRLNEPGPNNVAKCTGVWDTAGNWLSSTALDALGLNDLAAVGYSEPSAMFGPQRQDGFWSCGTRTRTYAEFGVEGKIVANGQIQVPNGKLTALSPNGTQLAGGTVARRGCSGNIAPACTTSVPNRSGQTGALAYLNGTPEDSDPGRTSPTAPAQNPTDIAEPFKPVPITGLQPRTQAYYLNSNGTLAATATCGGADRTIVFLPGWYKSAKFLNDFTSNASCNDATFWFAPDPGVDGRLMTADDKTGAFLMDFRTSTDPEVECHDTYAKRTRWCIGGNNAQNARVVVGTPEGWSPFDPVGSGTSSTYRKPVNIGTAGTVDNDLSVRWYSSNNAASIDGSFATYTPCSIFNLFSCPSTDRAIRLRDFTPKTTGPPVSESGHPKGRLFVTVAYGMENGSSLAPAIVVEAVSPQSGRKSCGTYTLPKLTYGGSGALPTATLEAWQAEQLADACGSVDLINGLEVKFQATGNFWNSGNPKVYLDGVKLHYETFSGASFPNPDPNNGADPAAAKSDCDPDEPGAQLIFTGESHVYVADGSLEVCAGPYPADPETHQSIGIYGVPAVAPVKAADVISDGGRNSSVNYTGASGAARLAIGEPGGRQDITVNYGNYTGYDVMNVGGALQGVEGRIRVRMDSYTPPTGFKVKRVDLRISYNTNNSCFLWCAFSATSKLDIGGYGEIDLPRNPSILQYANNASVNLYDSASGSNKINPTAGLQAGTQEFVFKARSTCILAVVVFTCGDSNDQLEGIELDIALEPTTANANTPMLIPQYGCITAHPNYEAGAAGPDCAVLKADSRQNTETYNIPFTSNREGNWVGRASVKGTIYAPSSAVEVDDADNAYPLATRGVVLRHLRVSGWKYRTGYSGTPISNNLDRTPAPREATFTACEQVAGRVGNPCSQAAGDVVLGAARVRFEVAGNQANVPNVVWWSSEA